MGAHRALPDHPCDYQGERGASREINSPPLTEHLVEHGQCLGTPEAFEPWASAPGILGSRTGDEVSALGLNVDEVASYASPIDLAAVEDCSRLTCVDRQEGNFITLAARRSGDRWISGSLAPPVILDPKVSPTSAAPSKAQ